MAGRAGSREGAGRGAGRGTPGRGPPGRGTPGRGAGGYGSSPAAASYATPPPPPPSSGGRGRGGRASGYVNTPGRGPSPASVGARGRGGAFNSSGGAQGRGRGTFSPAAYSQQQQQRQAPFQRSPSSGSSGGRGRGYVGGAAGGGSSMNSGSAFASASGGAGAGGRVFGRGAEAVAYARDKEKDLWKVGPPPGQRFSAGFLRGLTNFVAWRQQAAAAAAAPAMRQQVAAPRQQQQQERQPQPTGQQWAEDEAQDTPMPRQRPAVTVERVPCEAGDGEGGGAAFDEMRPASSPAAPAPAAAMGMSPGGSSNSIDNSAFRMLSPERSGGGSGISRSSSGGSDLGWASVLGAHAAGAAAAESASSSDNSMPSPGVPSPPAAEGSRDSSTVAAPDEVAGPPAPAVAAVNGAAGSTTTSGASSSSLAEQVGCSSTAEPHREWWPASELSLETAAEEPTPAVVVQEQGAALPRVQLSLRLERMALTDREAQMVADWCCQHKEAADIRKLWLFDNRLGDEGAAAVARILAAHPDMAEVHLSHNMLTLRGATALLEALPVPEAAGAAAPSAAASAGSGQPPPAASTDQDASTAAVRAAESEAAEGPAQAQAVAQSDGAAAGDVVQEAAAMQQAPPPLGPPAAAAAPNRPVWLRLEWNRISLEGLMQVLEAQHAQRGLLVDLPSAVRADAAPSLPDLPPYLAAAAAEAPAAPTSVPASRGARNALQFMLDRCHARLPWISCQYQLPSEAAVLKAARTSWRQQQHQQSASASEEAEPAAAASSGAAAAPTPSATGAGSRGPLLLFPDTSALLPMLGASADVSLPTFFTLDLLGQLAQQGRFGRGLPAHEQVFVVVTDSVLKQLDGLKNEPGARPAVRRFMGQGLDAYGPAGADFLTVLGAHEGEGLLMEHDAAVAGSGSADVSSKGQRADHKIVEVALFFQQQVLKEAAPPGPSASGSGGGGGNAGSGSSSSLLDAGSFPVLLLSGDNAQVQTARSHGLPAVRMADVAAAQRQLEAALMGGAAAQQGAHALTASLLRSFLGAAAVTGLGTAAVRSLQAEFDEAVAALTVAVDALESSQRQLAELAAALPAPAPAAAAPGSGSEELSAVAVDPEAAVGALQTVQRILSGPAGPTADSAGSSGDSSGSGEVLRQPENLVPALRARLAEWQQLVRSHQDPSRLLRWAAASAGTAGR